MPRGDIFRPRQQCTGIQCMNVRGDNFFRGTAMPPTPNRPDLSIFSCGQGTTYLWLSPSWRGRADRTRSLPRAMHAVKIVSCSLLFYFIIGLKLAFVNCLLSLHGPHMFDPTGDVIIQLFRTRVLLAGPVQCKN